MFVDMAHSKSEPPLDIDGFLCAGVAVACISVTVGYWSAADGARLPILSSYTAESSCVGSSGFHLKNSLNSLQRGPGILPRSIAFFMPAVPLFEVPRGLASWHGSPF